MVQKAPFLPFLTFSQTKMMKTECFFSHNATFITLKGEINHVFNVFFMMNIHNPLRINTF
jgi:hypothetical protein